MFARIVAFLRRVRGDFEMSVTESLKLYSQKLNALMTLFVIPYIIASNGGFVATVIDKLPEGYRMIVAPFIGVITFMLVTWARLRVQSPTPPPNA